MADDPETFGSNQDSPESDDLNVGLSFGLHDEQKEVQPFNTNLPFNFQGPLTPNSSSHLLNSVTHSFHPSQFYVNSQGFLPGASFQNYNAHASGTNMTNPFPGMYNVNGLSFSEKFVPQSRPPTNTSSTFPFHSQPDVEEEPRPKRRKRTKKECQQDGCSKYAQGGTDFCVGHGGGIRCIVEGCTNGSRGSCGRCISHGGGKRCHVVGCPKAAAGSTNFCVAHGGGRRCNFENCLKSAQGTTSFCVKHGGGNRCQYPGCSFGARGKSTFCQGHSSSSSRH